MPPVFYDYDDPPSANDSSIVDEPFSGGDSGMDAGPADALLAAFMDPPLSSVTCPSKSSAYKVRIAGYLCDY